MSDSKSPLKVFITAGLPESTKTWEPPGKVFVTVLPAFPVSKDSDTARNHSGLATHDIDTERKVVRAIGKVVIDFDTMRRPATHELADTDTLKNVVYGDSADIDTSRIVKGNISSDFDTARYIPCTTQGLNPSKVSISLQRGTLSDTFQITTPYDMALESTITGKLLDFDYKFLVYESNGRGLMRTMTGMYDIDKLLYMPFNYRVNRRNATAKDHARRIAELIGKQLIIGIDDFIPDDTHERPSATIQDLMSAFFGWMGNLPQRWINVFLRGDKLYIIQRGHELNTIDITNTHHSRPAIDKHLMRSVWCGAENTRTRSLHISSPYDENDKDDNGENVNEMGEVPFSGTISFGSASCTYSGGLLTKEVTTMQNGKSETNYSYSGGYITNKNTKVTTNGESGSEETQTDTNYSYASAGNELYIATETETVTQKTNGSETDKTVRTTQHVFLGNNWYGTATYVDGEFQGSVVSQGKPGGKTTPYTVKMANWSLHNLKGQSLHDWLKSKWGAINQEIDKETTIHGTALFDTSFPVKDRDTLIALTKDIEWLNRKTEERLTMDIWQYPHLIDFTDRVRYNGHDYYLESNEVTQTPRELKQSVTLVRWY